MTKTPRERILERALEMAARFRNKDGCFFCPIAMSECELGRVNKPRATIINCQRRIKAHFIRKATNESKAKGKP